MTPEAPTFGPQDPKQYVGPLRDADRPATATFLENYERSITANDVETGHVGRYQMWVAVDGDHVVGYLEGAFDQVYDEEWCGQVGESQGGWISEILVSEDRRLQDWGSRLVRKFVGDGAAEGCRFVALQVNHHEPVEGRSRFFSRLGFQVLRDQIPVVVGASTHDLLNPD